MAETKDAITFARAEEQLRQEREAFDQKKKQDQIWFYLRLATGIVALLLLLALCPACFYIFVNHKLFTDIVVKAAVGSLFVDLVGLIVLIVKVVIGGGHVKPLEPVTRASIDKVARFSKQQSSKAPEHSTTSETS